MKEIEALWLARHPEILQKYRGQYIAVSGERLLGKLGWCRHGLKYIARSCWRIGNLR